MALLLGCSAASTAQEITDYDSCVKAGNPVLRMLPPACRAADGTVYRKEGLDLLDLTASQSQSLCVESCGDGECQEIVCQGTGCPCAETVDSCPEDCGQEQPNE
ncbi:MAG: hypothetical protein KDD53_02270 [Bdellovibrionales bacterium]|nr:hypothetical protein [Bdellovibrionales bacterium]